MSSFIVIFRLTILYNPLQCAVTVAAAPPPRRRHRRLVINVLVVLQACLIVINLIVLVCIVDFMAYLTQDYHLIMFPRVRGGGVSLLPM